MKHETLEPIQGLTRIEQVSNDEMNEQLVEMTHAVYPHRKAYAAAFTLEQYIEADPAAAFFALQEPAFIEQWSYSCRNHRSMEDNEFQLDELMTNTPINCRITSHAQSQVIDLHWQLEDGSLIRHDSLRLLDAQASLKKNGTVLLLTSSHPPAVGAEHINDMKSNKNWKPSAAQRKLELNNIKILLEQKDTTGNIAS